MPDECRKSILVPIYKNKGNIHYCNNYDRIKIISYTMKFGENATKQWMRREPSIFFKSV